MTECFPGGWAQLRQTGGEVVGLSLQDKFVLEFRKVAPVSAQTDRCQKNGLKCVFLWKLCWLLKFNGGYKTEKPRHIFLSTLGIQYILCSSLAMMCSAFFSVSVLKNKKNRKT